ncbi:hypothetical protein HHX47_DHR2000685 [Lentinula edodes]|nr:hypothetical protein HHX47_DHR2000685 [Lentinula edodes]
MSEQPKKPLPFVANFAAGAIAGVSEILTFYPLDVVKTRMQLSTEKSQGFVGTFRNIVKEEGHIWWNGGYFGCIFQVRAMLPEAKTQQGTLFNNFISGAVGGFVGTMINTPFDVVKSRIQSAPRIPGVAPKYDWTYPSLAIIAREEGVGALYKGFVPKVLRLAPGGGFSGLFAGLTLGYFSLDLIQLNVLAMSGSPKQREYASKIKPIRENGHLLLVTLLLANMIVNESLPIISTPVLGGGVQSVVVSTILIVIFSEIIPQSLFTRHGLYLGAKMAGFTKALIYVLGIVSWPVAKLLEFVLGPHHGIIYRRAELKELIAMHSSMATHGGDLKTDTVTIIGATLDLQEKVAMTPINDVFMLSIDSELDYDLLKKILAIAASVKKAVKHSLTQRLRERVMGDSSDSSDDEKEKDPRFEKKFRRRRKIKNIEERSEDGEDTLKGEHTDDSTSRSHIKCPIDDNEDRPKSRRSSFQLSRAAAGLASISNLEQSMPADAVLAKEGAEAFLQGFDPAISPLGIITLEDVLEELIGEEIYDEFDPEGAHGDPYLPPAQVNSSVHAVDNRDDAAAMNKPLPPTLKPLSLKGLSFLRSRSAPPSPRDTVSYNDFSIPNATIDHGPPPSIPRTNSHSNVENSRTPTSIYAGEERIVRGPPSIIVEQYDVGPPPTSISSDERPAYNPAEEATSEKLAKVPPYQPTIFSPVAKVANAPQFIPPGSRSASPAPSLEAFLLDRKRRIGVSASGSPGLLAASTGASLVAVPVAGSVSLRSTPSKGARFKSTPLGGIDKPGNLLADRAGRSQDTTTADENSGTNQL